MEARKIEGTLSHLRRGGRGRKVVPIWFVPSGMDPVDVWEVPQPEVRDRVAS